MEKIIKSKRKKKIKLGLVPLTKIPIITLGAFPTQRFDFQNENLKEIGMKVTNLKIRVPSRTNKRFVCYAEITLDCGLILRDLKLLRDGTGHKLRFPSVKKGFVCNNGGCEKVNCFDDNYCSRCGLPLEDKGRLKVKSISLVSVADKEFKRELFLMVLNAYFDYWRDK